MCVGHVHVHACREEARQPGVACILYSFSNIYPAKAHEGFVLKA